MMTPKRAEEAAGRTVSHRVRVLVDFEVEIQEDGFPGWLDDIVEWGINALVAFGAVGPVRLTRFTRTFTRVPEAEIRRREARAARKAGSR